MRGINTVKQALVTIRNNRPWQRGHARLLLRHALGSSAGSPAFAQHDDFDHLRAAARWLAAAQDSQRDGGICGRYRLDRGWTSSYPETTGYAIPTLLSLADTLGEEEFRDRARQCGRISPRRFSLRPELSRAWKFPQHDGARPFQYGPDRARIAGMASRDRRCTIARCGAALRGLAGFDTGPDGSGPSISTTTSPAITLPIFRAG